MSIVSTGPLKTIPQGAAIMLLGLVVGSMFGIWRGYDPSAFTAATFLEVHQGAVRGLNLLLPALGGASLVLTLGLAVAARRKRSALALYLAAIVLIAVGAVVTRFGNQPINELVIGWTPDTIPANWAEIRDSWWHWHLLRLGACFVANIVLINAVFADRAR